MVTCSVGTHLTITFARPLNFIRRILDNELQLVISYVDGVFRDAWVTDDVASDEKYSPQ